MSNRTPKNPLTSLEGQDDAPQTVKTASGNGRVPTQWRGRPGLYSVTTGPVWVQHLIAHQFRSLNPSAGTYAYLRFPDADLVADRIKARLADLTSPKSDASGEEDT